jgi:hypothetical protein
VRAVSEVPLLLLDVDGVLNALADEVDPSTWPSWRQGHATADGTAWPIRWAPDAVARLRSWHESGHLELQWLTTWGHEANLELRALLGLPELAVAGTYDDVDDDAGSIEPDAAGAHAAVAPSAPDELSGRWWKHDVVRRLHHAQPHRRIVWIDDELHADSPHRTWAESVGIVAIRPDPRSGLRPIDLAVVASVIGHDDDSAW